MKDTIIGVLIFLFIIITIALGAANIDRESKMKNDKEVQLIKECLAHGRRVEQVGNGIFTNTYLVCQPK